VTTGEFLVAFVLYADSLLSINQIATLLDRAYNTIYSAIRDVETALNAASTSSGTGSIILLTGQPRSMKLSKCVQVTRDATHRGTACPAAGRQKAGGHGGAVSKVTS